MPLIRSIDEHCFRALQERLWPVWAWGEYQHVLHRSKPGDLPQ
jgi:hypothetical protein